MRYTNKKPLVAGVYLTDHNKVAPSQFNVNFWTPQGDTRFLPLLNHIELRNSAEFRLAATTPDVTDIEAHNRTVSTQRYRPELLKFSKMDTSTGDFLIGGSRIILNFSNQVILGKTRTDIPKMFFPITNKQLEGWEGKVVVLSFHSFNTPEVIRNVTGLANYFRNLMEEARRQGEASSTKMLILEHLSQCWESVKPTFPGTVSSNTIKICLLHEYTLADFAERGSNTPELCCSETGVLLQLSEDILGMSKHPKLMDDLVANKQVVHALRDNGVSCFIVDNTNVVGNRFINFAGSIRMIPKVQSTTQPPGLYIVSVDSDKTVDAGGFVPLEDIDKNPYIFRSQEEAERGTDIREQAMQNFEMDKLTLSSENMQLRHRHEEELRQLDLEAKRRQAETDRRNQQIEEDHQKALQALRLELETMKQKGDENKHNFDLVALDRKNYYDAMGSFRKYDYDSGKYLRDSTVETIKTFGSIAGLIAGGYVLYRQLSK